MGRAEIRAFIDAAQTLSQEDAIDIISDPSCNAAIVKIQQLFSSRLTDGTTIESSESSFPALHAPVPNKFCGVGDIGEQRFENGKISARIGYDEGEWILTVSTRELSLPTEPYARYRVCQHNGSIVGEYYLALKPLPSGAGIGDVALRDVLPGLNKRWEGCIHTIDIVSGRSQG